LNKAPPFRFTYVNAVWFFIPNDLARSDIHLYFRR
jgi:hypothetical protein